MDTRRASTSAALGLRSSRNMPTSIDASIPDPPSPRPTAPGPVTPMPPDTAIAIATSGRPTRRSRWGSGHLLRNRRTTTTTITTTIIQKSIISSGPKLGIGPPNSREQQRRDPM